MDLNILISGSSDTSWCFSYDEAVAQAGGIPHSAYLPEVDAGYDGLLLCGGGDLDPIHFAQENQGSTDIDPARDERELALARAYLAAGKPILAVCRGHQLLNVALGGTLIQDLPAPQKVFHTRAAGSDQDRVHPIRTAENSILRRLYSEVFPVNSYHHQATDLLGQDLKVTARSEAGIVEAMEHKTLPVLCVQFHPERMTLKHASPDLGDGGAIFTWFMERCREAK